jgi:hypothetical protein
MDEKEMADIMLEHFVGTFPPISPGLFWTRERIADIAAHAIAEKMGKGMVYEDTFKARDREDHMRLTSSRGDAEFSTTADCFGDGQFYTITVRRKDADS